MVILLRRRFDRFGNGRLAVDLQTNLARLSIGPARKDDPILRLRSGPADCLILVGARLVDDSTAAHFGIAYGIKRFLELARRNRADGDVVHSDAQLIFRDKAFKPGSNTIAKSGDISSQNI